MQMEKSTLTTKIKALARELGFSDVGIAPLNQLPGRDDFSDWLAQGNHAQMSYLAENIDMRYSPAEILPGAKSAICLLLSYAPASNQNAPHTPLISRHAQGRDYHKVLKKRAHKLCDKISQFAPGFKARAFVDTAPIAERQLAVQAGLGWIGKSGMFISPSLGNQIFLCEIICNLELVYDSPIAEKCGSCQRCLLACPTGAILPNGKLDARKCLSYHTLENRGEIPRELFPAFKKTLAGCDSCLLACPHSQCESPGDPEFTPLEKCSKLTLKEVLSFAPEQWDEFTKGGSRRRATHKMYLRNAILIAGNNPKSEYVSLIENILLDHPDLENYASWAISQINLKLSIDKKK